MVSFYQVFKFFKPRPPAPNQGFTLIELLVAMIISSIVLVSLLGFMNTILNTSRREEVKATSEREVQDALDLIADDVNQAIYIYDRVSLYGDTTATPPITGIAPSVAGNQLPVLTNLSADRQTPVLVLWKRNFLSRTACVTLSTGSQVTIPTYTGAPGDVNPCPGANRIRVGCLTKISTATGSIQDANNNSECSNQDYTPYSLVVYYLTSRGTSGLENTLSSTLQIRRLELRDGIRSPVSASGVACASPLPAGTDGCRIETFSGGTGTTPINYLLMPDTGFQRFDISTATNVSTGMASWTRWGPYANNITAPLLIDFIDQTNTQVPVSACPAGSTQVPDFTRAVAAGFPVSTGFYACVDSANTVATVYLRGNALARMNSRTRTAPQFSQTTSSFFPIVNTTIRGRGFLNITPTN